MRILPSNFTIDRYGLHARFVNENDAEFIVRLRTDEMLGRFINSTRPDVSVQVEWIEKYKTREAVGEDFSTISYALC